ncbi:MAG: 4'-phosphopantetheinyl transferase superfamily protein [Oscillospiraceae bacterium]|nr:4'-phosphopantetheinyl transferase superfamily protein [Oscillospiraceae bacterium]
MNNLYTGTSIIEIDRIKKSLKNTKFLARLFSPQELKYLMKKRFSVNKTAEMFCGKLAFAKAMGYDFRGCKLSEVSVLTDFMDTPYISLSGNAKLKFTQKHCNMTLSVSCSRNYATAVVVFFNKN